MNNCWSCHGTNEEGALFCITCNAVQAPNTNPFSLFGLNESFNIDKNKIEKIYLNLQKQLHPDNFVMKSPSEQMKALNAGANLNNAYNILTNNIKLSVQLLENNDIKDALNKKPSMELMQEQFELREQLEEIKDLENLKQQVETKLETCYKNLSDYFALKDYEQAAEKTVELQFLTKFSNDVKRKLRTQK